MLEDSASLWASMATWFTPTVLFVLLNLVIGTIAVSSRLAGKKPHANNHHDHDHQHFFSSSVPLNRSPSVLQRLKSINFYSHRSQEPTTNFHKPQEPEPNFAFSFSQYRHEEQSSSFARSPSLLQRLKSSNIYNYVISQPSSEPQPQPQQTLEPVTPPREEDDHVESLDEIYSKLKGGHVIRSASESVIETAPAAAERRGRKMKKSASAKAPKGSAAARGAESPEAVEARRPATVREAKRREEEEEDGEVDARADDFINKFKQQLKLQRLDSILRARK